MCTDGVAALQHRAEVSWGSPVAVGNEEREAGTIGFVSFDTATNVRAISCSFVAVALHQCGASLTLRLLSHRSCNCSTACA